MALTKFHQENFNDQHLHMWVPDFVSNEHGHHRPWLLWMYCVGLNHGFHNGYQFYIADYLLCLPYYTTAKDEIPRFNALYGDWVKIGYRDPNLCWFQFQNSDWTFVEHMETDARLQRMWIHLWNSVYTCTGTTVKTRDDLFYTDRDIVATIPNTGDWQPFIANGKRLRGERIQKSKGTTKYARYPASYIRKGGSGKNALPWYPKFRLKDE